jgi:bacterioferritin-associated ferredoxin
MNTKVRAFSNDPSSGQIDCERTPFFRSGAPMIVCVCNNVSDRKIRKAVNAGMTSMVELRKHLDVGTCCGKCHSCVKQVLRECLDDAAKPGFCEFGAMAA